ncbi:hypothetical protein [Flavobacterium macacae]|uniref:Uncharacterized protein n=1 Tax=Flavobacterium macacae TaxID=2488993 RepID=A0A3P3W2C0_9FLAO|nr:hypothetical protein [Flavobacterium macacae]RRJ87779.1 hypothetical protein EG849_15050 [Flavobacterium macacae]
MSEFIEFLKSFHESARERFKSPLIGTFSIAFLIYNWRPIYILMFSKENAETRIEHVDVNYCSLWAIIIPLGVSLFYVLLLPELHVLVDKKLKNVTKERITEKIDIRVHRLTEDQRIFQLEFTNNQIKSGNKDLDELNNKLMSQQKLIDNMNEQHKSSSESYEKFIETGKINEENYKKMISDLNKQLERQRSQLKYEDLVNLANKKVRPYSLSDKNLLFNDFNIQYLDDKLMNALFDVFRETIANGKQFLQLSNLGKGLLEYYYAQGLVDYEMLLDETDGTSKYKVRTKV